MDISMLESYRDMYCSAGHEQLELKQLPQNRARNYMELEKSLTEGQYVLCRWSDGLYYLGKIVRVSHLRTQCVQVNV